MIRASVVATLLSTCWSFPCWSGDLEIIAHRGVHQPLSKQVSIAPWACTAELVQVVEHRLVENSLPSIRAAFAAGATAVEIDVHASADGEAVVFHDWTLDCRTDASGVTEQQPLANLLAADIGYGTSPDHGASHPLRGKGLRMPTLRQVLDAFPDGQFLVNMKSGKPEALLTILDVLADYPDRDLVFYCRKDAFNRMVQDHLPWIRVPKLDRRQIKRCLKALALPLGPVPDLCRGAELMLPWDRFDQLGPLATPLLERIHGLGSKLYLWGVDDVEAARCASRLGVDGIVTDRIETVGPATRPPFDSHRESD